MNASNMITGNILWWNECK